MLKDGKPLKTYRVALGGDPVGPKRQQGDHRTPEGHYIIDFHNSSSAFHLSLHISYPNADDRRQAARRGVAPGDAIMIHGLPNGLGGVGEAHRLRDWTDGCIAVTDSEIEEIARAVPDGTPLLFIHEDRHPTFGRAPPAPSACPPPKTTDKSRWHWAL